MFKKLWNYFSKKKTPISLSVEIKTHPTSPEELLAIFTFDWPKDLSETALINYYGRLLFLLQNGHFYDTILQAFEKRAEKYYPEESSKLKDVLNIEMQKLFAQIAQNTPPSTGLEEHLRQPVILPSDVFNFKYKIGQQQNGRNEEE